MHVHTNQFRDPGWRWPLPQQLDSPQTLLMVFGAPELGDHPALAALRDQFPASALVGCSTAGEILGAEVSDASLALAVVRFEHSELRVVSQPITAADQSYAVGQQLAAALAGPGLRSVFVLSDGLGVNGSELVKGLTSSLPPGVVVTGGLAADGDRFQRTWVISEGQACTGRITATGFYGDRLRVCHGSRGGWDSFGPERRITRSQGNVLYELDGKPALQLYKDYLGDRASGLPATGLLFPLAIRADANDQRQIVRTILAVNEAEQSMTFAGDVPKGHLAQLMRANFDRLVTGASEAADLARANDAGDTSPLLAVAISCVGRRLVLGERVEEETEVTLDSLGPGAQQVGFYSYGEISPHTSGGCDLHNQTMTLTTWREC